MANKKKLPEFEETQPLPEFEKTQPLPEFEQTQDLLEQPGLAEQALALVGEGIQKGIIEPVEKYAYAPARSAYLSIAAGEPTKAPKAFAEQFGAPPEEAPTMAEVMRVAGVPEVQVPVLPPGIQSPTEAMIAYQMQNKLKAQPTISLPELTGMGAEMALDPAAAMIGGATQLAKGAKFVPSMVGAVAKPIVGTTLEYAVKPVVKGVAGLVAGGAAGIIKDTAAAEKAAKTAGIAVEKIYEGAKQLPQKAVTVYENLKPNIRDKYVDQVLLAQRNGIDTNLIVDNPSLLYGENEFVTKAKRTEAGMGVSNLAEKYDELQLQVGDALENNIQNVTKGQAVNNQVNAGQKLVEAFDKKVDEVFNNAETRYSNVLEKAGNPKMNNDQKAKLFGRLEQIQKEQQRIVDTEAFSPTAKQQAQSTVNAINVVIDSIIEGDTDALVRQMQSAGKAANKPGRYVGELAAIGPDRKVLDNIYTELKGSVKDIVASSNPKLLGELEQSNKLLSDFFDKTKFISGTISKAKNEEKPFEAVYKDLIGSANSLKLKAVSELFSGTEELEAVRGQVLYDLLAKRAGESPAFQTVKKSFQEQPIRRKLEALFNPNELKDFEGLIDLGKDMGAKEINTSRSGTVMMLEKMVKSPLSAVEGVLTGQGTIATLEEKAMENYFKNYSIPQIIAVRGQGLFDENMIQNVLKNRLADTNVSKTIRQAVLENKILPEYLDVISKIESNSPPVNSYSAIKKYMVDLGETTGMGLAPGLSTKTQATRILSVIGQSQYAGGKQKPVFIPESERADVSQAIIESPMSSIQKAKNIKALNSSGYLLDLSNIDQKPIEKAAPRAFKKSESELAPLKEDRPDLLKSIKSKELKGSMEQVVEKLRGGQ